MKVLLKQVTEIYTEEQGMSCLWLKTNDLGTVLREVLPVLQGNQFECIMLEDGRHYEIIDMSEETSPYREGDFVTFQWGKSVWEDDKPVKGEEYDEWADNQINKITPDGKYEFSDFEGEWPIDIISGFAEDQRLEVQHD